MSSIETTSDFFRHHAAWKMLSKSGTLIDTGHVVNVSHAISKGGSSQIRRSPSVLDTKFLNTHRALSVRLQLTFAGSARLKQLPGGSLPRKPERC